MPHAHPQYSLAPEVGALHPEQVVLLDAMAGYFAKREEEFTVVKAVTTEEHHVFELETTLGPVLMLERRNS